MVASVTGQLGEDLANYDNGLIAVLCGTFRRDPSGLRDELEHLRSRYRVIAPTSVDFASSEDGFVRLVEEKEDDATTIENRHLAAIRKADFVWLFCPSGYVGTSAAMEIGFAHSAGVPIFATEVPTDPVLRGMVDVVPSIDRVAETIQPSPGQGLATLQEYYRRAAERRGWANESARDTLLLLTEELGELARAVRKEAGLARDGAYGPSGAAEEMADVQLYLVHLASALGVDLAEAVTAKEAANSIRHKLAARGAA
jgi:NTP pyrophosphatase (non-canonical NTP hydrolase)